MRVFTSTTRLFFSLLFLSSSFLQASLPSLSPEFGVIKSKDSEIFLSCSKADDNSKKCSVYLLKKGEEEKKMTKEMKFLNFSKKNEAFSLVVKQGLTNNSLPLAYIPMTSLALGLTFLGGLKYSPLFLLAPLDLAVIPFGAIGDGCYRLYKLIQGTYLKRAWETVMGMNKKKSMKLSRKDFEEFISVLKRSRI